MNTPQDIINFRTYRVVWQSFLENRFRDVAKSFSRKKKNTLYENTPTRIMYFVERRRRRRTYNSLYSAIVKAIRGRL